MTKRIFLAINLPENLKRKLAGYKDKWPEIPANWVKEFNMHITLAFLGYVRDENLPDIIKKTKEVCDSHQSFEINLNKISYGPLGKPARMVWMTGEKSDALTKLAHDLEKSLLSGISQNMEKYLPGKKEGIRQFSPHITLARIKQMQFKRMELEDIPEINETINFRLEVNSIEIMESEFKKSGPNYIVLESFELQ